MSKKRLAKAGQFLLSTELPDPDARLGRRKRARERAASKGDGGELAAEQRPRTSQPVKEPSSQLPRIGEVEREAPDGEDMGRKKRRRLEVLQGKRAQKENRKMVAQAKDLAQKKSKTDGQAKGEKPSGSAAELLKRAGGSEGDRRLLASAAERIASTPEKELDLFDVFFEIHSTGSDARTRTLALLSAVAVFRDLVPGYRIREATEKEKEVQRSKDVMGLEKYELSLLKVYKRLLSLLEVAMKRDPAAIASALSVLVKAASDFNYRQKLLGIAVRHANGPCASARRVIVDALREMVAADRRMDATREVVLAIGALAKNAAGKKGQTDAPRLAVELFEVLLHLSLGKAETAELHSDNLGDADEEMRRELAETSVQQNAAQARKAEAELLTEIFVVYLRCLRQRHLHSRETIASILTGLARWGQQVNIELLAEILSELRQVVEGAISQSDELVSLQGLNCVMVLLAGPAQALATTDLSWLADAMRSGLSLAAASMSSAFSESSAWPPPRCLRFDPDLLRHELHEQELSNALESSSVPALVLRCLTAALKCPQAYGKASDSSLALLVEDLAHLSVLADSSVAVMLLRELALLLRRHRQLQTLLDAEGGIFRLGGLADRAISVAWHLHPLAASPLPVLARAGRELSTVVPSRLLNVSDIFPDRDARRLLAAEPAHHLVALQQVKPDVTPTGRRGAFSTEGELRACVGTCHV